MSSSLPRFFAELFPITITSYSPCKERPTQSPPTKPADSHFVSYSSGVSAARRVQNSSNVEGSVSVCKKQRYNVKKHEVTNRQLDLHGADGGRRVIMYMKHFKSLTRMKARSSHPLWTTIGVGCLKSIRISSLR